MRNIKRALISVSDKSNLKTLIKTMKKWNGKVIEIPYTKGISSSIIKKKLL